MKRFLLIPFIVSGWICATTAEIEQYVVHESRVSVDVGWSKGDKIAANVWLPVRIGLKPNDNAARNAHDWLMDVSDPDSRNYGKHWTLDRVIETFQPSDKTVQEVQQWLTSTGLIDKSRITHSANKAWLAFDAPAGVVEKLLKTEYHEYSHMMSGQVEIACDEYSIPQFLKEHIDYITPGLKGIRVAREVGGSKSASFRNVTYHHHDPFSRIPPNNTLSLSICEFISTPACIRALYRFGIHSPNATVSPNNTMGIYESGEYLEQEDLDLYFRTFSPHIPNGTHPIIDEVDSTNATNFMQGEPNLDFSVAFPIIYPQNATLYQVNDLWYSTHYRYALFNTFLDAIDGSYCTYSAYGETGDNPRFDPTYPDTHINNGSAYKGKLMCGVYKPTNVISISYGPNEVMYPASYEKRQCNEFLKLALQGVSVFAASGDYGVYCARYGSNPIFGASAPGNCPYVTSVGGTKIAHGNSVYAAEVAAYARNIGDYVFSSSGGFSNVFPAPKWQERALSSYFANHDPPYPYYENGNYKNSTGMYNRNGRGYPDVSANGQHCPLFEYGIYRLTWGTSASTPIFAALINRINEERIRHGKGSVGLVNPVLYKHPEVLNDITEGNNTACTSHYGSVGFKAVRGWDPVTGLGTPDYPKMLELFLSLP